MYSSRSIGIYILSIHFFGPGIWAAPVASDAAALAAQPQQDPRPRAKDAKEKVAELFAVLGLNEHISSSLKAYVEILSQQLGLTLKRERDLSRKLDQAAIRDEIMASFLEQYTDAELDELTHFFRTPTGQKYLQNFPRMQEIAMKIVRTHLDRAVATLNP